MKSTNRNVIACRANDDYKLHLRFEDGLEGDVYLGNLLEVQAFARWRDLQQFRNVRPGSGGACVVWDSGVRLDSEILYCDIAARGGVRNDEKVRLDEQVRLAKSVVGREDHLGNGTGRFTPPQAASLTRLSEIGARSFWPGTFHQISKQMMWELHLFFKGMVIDHDGKEHGLHSRLSQAQFEEAREAFAILWRVIESAKLETSPYALAKQDNRFQQFLKSALQGKPQSRRRRHR